MADLKPEVLDSVNRNWNSMFNNFKKISSWLKNGSASEFAMPPVVMDFLTRFETLAETTQQVSGKLDTVASEHDQLLKTVTRLNKIVAEQGDLLKTLVAEAKSEAKSEVKSTPKATAKAEPKATAKAEPKTAAKAKDSVELSAAAVEAGDVSVAGLDEISSMIEGLLPEQPVEQVSEIDDL